MLLIAWNTAACQPRILARGNIPDVNSLSMIVAGAHTREDVEEMIGSPSTVTLFGDRVWYYISETIEKKTFKKPEVSDRKIIAIDFDARGLVENIRRYDMRHGRIVEMVARKTPTPGKEASAIEKLIGGIGDLSE